MSGAETKKEYITRDNNEIKRLFSKATIEISDMRRGAALAIVIIPKDKP